jgi:hypothetical protein
LTGIFGIGLLALRLESGFLPSSPVFLEVWVDDIDLIAKAPAYPAFSS